MLTEYFKTENRKYILTDTGRKELKQEYAKGYSQLKIAKKFNVSEDVIRQWFKEENIPTRRRIYSMNENYFETIDSEEKAYWIGFLSADGYIHQERGTIQFELQESDKNQVEKFALAVGSTRPILKIETNNFIHYRCVLNSRKMVNDLLKYNITQRKSLTFYPTNIPEKYIPYWIIGYMDGDGCIFNSKGRIKIHFTGTYDTLNFIKNYFNSNNQIGLEHRCSETHKFIPEVSICENFLRDVEYDKLSYVLKRKQMRYCSFI